MTPHTPRVLLLAIALLAPVALAKAAPTLVAPSGVPLGARAGTSLSCDHNTLVLGVPGDNAVGEAAGSVIIYTKAAEGWTEQARITGPAPKAAPPASYRLFGEAVAVSGSTVVIGVPYDGADTSGAAYVYVRNDGVWTLQAKLTPGDAQANQSFGNAVAIEGNSIVVGAFVDSSQKPNGGAAYVFTRAADVWTQRAKLTPTDLDESAFFGTSVAISGANVLVGAPTYEAAYVFTSWKNNWYQLARLNAFDEIEGDHSAFGASVAISGTTAVVGAPEEGMNAVGAGAVYTFTLKGRDVYKQKLTAPAGETDDRFGTSVSIEGDTIAVGSPFEGEGQKNDGAVYVFRRQEGSFAQTHKLCALPPQESEFLGLSVAVDGSTVVGSGPADAQFTATPFGGAYIFKLR